MALLDVLAPLAPGVLQGIVVLQDQRARVGQLVSQVLTEPQGGQDLKACQELRVSKATLVLRAIKV